MNVFSVYMCNMFVIDRCLVLRNYVAIKYRHQKNGQLQWLEAPNVVCCCTSSCNAVNVYGQNFIVILTTYFTTVQRRNTSGVNPFLTWGGGDDSQ